VREAAAPLTPLTGGSTAHSKPHDGGGAGIVLHCSVVRRYRPPYTHLRITPYKLVLPHLYYTAVLARIPCTYTTLPLYSTLRHRYCHGY
jgi:hypothetical protein